jgi:hypothetical protein
MCQNILAVDMRAWLCDMLYVMGSCSLGQLDNVKIPDKQTTQPGRLVVLNEVLL